MAVNQDSYTQSVPVSLSFTRQGNDCITPAFWEALERANLRVTLPTTTTGSTTTVVEASSLSDNIARIDSEGKVYVPGITKVELAEQTVTLSISTAPGVLVEIAFAATGVADLENALQNISFRVSPPEAAVYISPPRLTSGYIKFDVYRVQSTETAAPYPEILVTGSGRLFVIPSPSPA
jgi:hypothetical protein